MTTYYGVLRPVTAEDLEAHPKFADVPGLIPPDGHITFEAFRGVGTEHATYGVARRIRGIVLPRFPPSTSVIPHDLVTGAEFRPLVCCSGSDAGAWCGVSAFGVLFRF